MAREKTQMIKRQEYLAETEENVDAALDGVGYSLIFINNSSMAGNACVYQKDPDITDPEVMSLAWFAKYAYPTTKVSFSWQINYNFVWAQTGQLVPGVLFSASQSPGADLSTKNQITLVYDPANGAYNFANQTAGAQQGNLYILEDKTIPSISDASVGIGMSGFGTFVRQARPNLQLTFTPHPQYWITFGTFTQGEVLDIGEITNAAQISFPPGVYTMTATLNADNTWTVVPVSQSLAAQVRTRGRQLVAPPPALLKNGYPAYQCFKTKDRDVYCSSYEVNNHDEGATWVAEAIENFGLRASDMLGKPYLSNNIPQDAIEYP